MDDDAAHPRAVWWRRPRWRALDYAAAVTWIVAGVLRPGSPHAFESPDRPRGPVLVMVPGVYEAWHFMRPLARRLARHGLRVHMLPGLGRNRGDVESGARLLLDMLDDRGLRSVVLVAHSKGGLIGKHAMLADRSHRIAGMVTVNTPFVGSRYARLVPLRAVRRLVPGDPTIVALGGDSTVDARIVTTHSFWDPHVPDDGPLVEATDVVLATPGHFRPLVDPDLERLLVGLTDPPPSAA